MVQLTNRTLSLVVQVTVCWRTGGTVEYTTRTNNDTASLHRHCWMHYQNQWWHSLLIQALLNALPEPMMTQLPYTGTVVCTTRTNDDTASLYRHCWMHCQNQWWHSFLTQALLNALPEPMMTQLPYTGRRRIHVVGGEHIACDSRPWARGVHHAPHPYITMFFLTLRVSTTRNKMLTVKI